MREIRWGILGAGGIAHRFARALGHVEGARLVAISGRRPERLDAFAREFPVDGRRRYASVGDDGAAAHLRLVDDPDVDAVYLALPHGMHEAWAVRLLRAGKAVLCEKPAVLSEREARAIAEVARETGSLFMEAMKPRFMPARERVLELIAQGELGRIESVDVAHRVEYGDQTGRYLLDPVQGGTLYDLGCYGISWVDDLLDGTVEVESRRVRLVPASDGAPIDIADDVRLRVGGILSISILRATRRNSPPSAASPASAARSRSRCCTGPRRIRSGAMAPRANSSKPPLRSMTFTGRSPISAGSFAQAWSRAPSCRSPPRRGAPGSSTPSVPLAHRRRRPAARSAPGRGDAAVRDERFCFLHKRYMFGRFVSLRCVDCGKSNTSARIGDNRGADRR